MFQTTNKLRIGFWGIVVIAIMLSVLCVMTQYYLKGLKTKYSLLKQILEGFVKVVAPLILVLVIVTLVGDNINLIKESILVILPCEIVAIVVNPLPKWCFENNIEGLGEIVGKVFGGNKE